MTRKTALRIATTGLLAGLATLVPAPATAAGQIVGQSFHLQPGWNAIYLEVEPEAKEIASVFAGVPIASVWTWQPRTSPVEYIQDPGEGLLNRPGWLGYFPPGPKHFLTNLYTVQANRAYLVRLPDDATPLAMTVVGRPSLRRIQWVADSYTLTGLPVDPEHPPTFGGFFGASPAHNGQPVYRLEPAGHWARVASPGTEIIHAGEAYWVYSRGASTYTGPLQVDLEVGDSLDFGSGLIEKRVRIRNLSGGSSSVLVRQLPSASPVPLCYWKLDEQMDLDTGQVTKKIIWPDLPSQHGIQLAPGEERVLRLAVRRSDLAAEEAGSMLAVTDNSGTRRWIAVGALKGTAGGTLGTEGSSLAENTGLWVGSVIVDAVGETATDPSTPTAAGSEFAFRLILHINGTTGEVKLLKQVYQMWDDNGQQYVLIADDQALPAYDPAALRDGEPASYRISAPAYDFSSTELVMTPAGGFDPAISLGAGSLTCVLSMSATDPTNPFRHLFHPDHDDAAEVEDIDGQPYAVTRSWLLAFSATPPADLENSPEWGSTVVGGTFTETLGGLHHQDIAVAGTFRLWRVSDIPALTTQ